MKYNVSTLTKTQKMASKWNQSLPSHPSRTKTDKMNFNKDIVLFKVIFVVYAQFEPLCCYLGDNLLVFMLLSMLKSFFLFDINQGRALRFCIGNHARNILMCRAHTKNTLLWLVFV